MPKITRIQERDCVSENLGQDDEIEETYWGTLCISNIFAVPGWDELKFSLYIIRPRPIISLKKPISLNERPILVYVLFFLWWLFSILTLLWEFSKVYQFVFILIFFIA